MDKSYFNLYTIQKFISICIQFRLQISLKTTKGIHNPGEGTRQGTQQLFCTFQSLPQCSLTYPINGKRLVNSYLLIYIITLAYTISQKNTRCAKKWGFFLGGGLINHHDLHISFGYRLSVSIPTNVS